MIDSDPKEFRLFGVSRILEYIRRFSSTEKAVFGLFLILAGISAFIMAVQASNYFMVSIPVRGGELREGIVGLPRTVNPVLAITDADRDLSSLVYAGLMRYVDGSIETDIAQSYSISDNGLIYNFKLRDDVRFHDGTSLTADDVEFTIAKIQDPNLKSPRRADWTDVTVKKISPTEIQLVLKQPYSPFLTNTTVGILPKHIWSSVGDEQFIFSQYNIEAIGAGPYRFASMNRDAEGIPTEYRLEIWDEYHGKEPFLKKLVFDFFADHDKALGALEAGKIDSLAAVYPAAADRIDSAYGAASGRNIISSPLPRVFGIFLNQSQAAILADKNIRQALDISLDRETIIDTVLHGYGTAIRGPLPPGLIGRQTETDSTETIMQTLQASSTIAAAEKLIEKSGWKKDDRGMYIKKSGKDATTTLSFELYTADVEDLRKTAELVKDMWSRVGIEVNVRVFEANELYQNIIRTRKFDALLFGEHIGKDRDLYAFWHSSQRNAPGLNVTMYTNSKVDKILEDIRLTTGDPEARALRYADLEKSISADIPAVFLYSPDFIYVVPAKLKGVNLESITVLSDRWNSVDKWYINTEKVWKIFTTNHE